jgi:N-methylhydantoinase B/oxoprolinase/acetone carboxylase alpha subunit
LTTIDPIQLEIYWSRAIAIANEMMATLIRTSFSTVIRVNRDCSAAIFDEKGQMLAQPDHSAPAHIGCMPGVMRQILEQYPPASIRPGDVFITNDPWIGAGHTPDVYIASAVFRDDRLIGFTVTVAHHLDIGGRLGSTDSQDVFEEGLQIPLLKLYKAGERNDDLFRMIQENVRIPHVVLGDLDAQLAANQVGAARLLELAADYDLPGFVDIAEAISRASEKAMRAAVRALPNGVYEAEQVLEIVGEDGQPITIKLKIDIQDEQIIFDYAGTSAQVRRPINCVLNYTITFTTLAMKMALVPELPYNGGIQHPIVVKAPEGSVLNALRPAAFWRRTVLGMQLPDLIFKTVAPIMPDKVIAGSGSCPLWLWLFSGWRPDRTRFAFQTHIMAGLGAGSDNDGLPTASFPSSVTDTPVEVFENACPIVISKRELITDSGGAGRSRGGLGQEISFSPAPSSLGQLEGPLTIAYSAGRFQSGPEGFNGGHAGAPGLIEINGKAATNSLATIKVSGDDQVTLRLPGGGGFHSPLLRSPDMVRQDVVSGFVSADAAETVYGVVLKGPSLTVDERATAALRASLRGGGRAAGQRASAVGGTR